MPFEKLYCSTKIIARLQPSPHLKKLPRNAVRQKASTLPGEFFLCPAGAPFRFTYPFPIRFSSRRILFPSPAYTFISSFAGLSARVKMAKKRTAL